MRHISLSLTLKKTPLLFGVLLVTLLLTGGTGSPSYSQALPGIPLIPTTTSVQPDVQESPKLFVMSSSETTAIAHELPLRAVKSGEQVTKVQDFKVGLSNVLEIPLNGKLNAFSTESIQITNVKLTNTQNQVSELSPVQNVIAFAGFPQGVYTLDVLVYKDGRDLAYEGILVIGQVQTAAVNKAIAKETTTYVFEDKPKPKPNICYFDPDNKACDQLPGGGCPKGFGFNDDDRCIPIGECPSGYGRLDDDETGKCYQDRDIKTCPDGYVTHKSYKCPAEPVVCPAGQELSSDGLGCAPPCDGSYQDCIYNGYLCKAGSSEHACELPLEEEEAETEQELSCQPEDDFCEPGCESPSMDCIDDVNIGDDGEDSTNEEDESGDEEEETSNCGGEPCTDTEKEDSWTDDETAADEEAAADEGGDTGN